MKLETIDKITLSIGLNDKDTKKQIISTDDAKKVITKAVYKYCNGGTVTNATGIYTHENGEKVQEHTIVVYMYGEPLENVEKLANHLKKALNQETIAIEIQSIKSAFI